MSEAERRERLRLSAEPARRRLSELIGLDESSARSLGDLLGLVCVFNDADEPRPERLSFVPDRLRLYLRAGIVV